MTKKVRATRSGGGPDDDTVPDGGPDNHDSNPRRETPQRKIPNPFRLNVPPGVI